MNSWLYSDFRDWPDRSTFVLRIWRDQITDATITWFRVRGFCEASKVASKHGCVSKHIVLHIDRCGWKTDFLQSNKVVSRKSARLQHNNFQSIIRWHLGLVNWDSKGVCKTSICCLHCYKYRTNGSEPQKSKWLLLSDDALMFAAWVGKN